MVQSSKVNHLLAKQNWQTSHQKKRRKQQKTDQRHKLPRLPLNKPPVSQIFTIPPFCLQHLEEVKQLMSQSLWYSMGSTTWERITSLLVLLGTSLLYHIDDYFCNSLISQITVKFPSFSLHKFCFLVEFTFFLFSCCPWLFFFMQLLVQTGQQSIVQLETVDECIVACE